MSFSWYNKNIKHILTALVICIINVSCFTPQASAQVSKKGEIIERRLITYVDSCPDPDTCVMFYGHYINSYYGVSFEYWLRDTTVNYTITSSYHIMQIDYNTSDINTLDQLAHDLIFILPHGYYIIPDEPDEGEDYNCCLGMIRLRIR